MAESVTGPRCRLQKGSFWTPTRKLFSGLEIDMACMDIGGHGS